MEYRKLGPTGMTTSVLGFGCFDYTKPNRELWGEEYIGHMSAMVNRAIDSGITCFHTAPHYASGDSEIMLGRALGARRKDVVVVTMCGLGFEGSQEGRPGSRDGRRESILPLVDRSLQRLQTDYIDVLQVHAPDVHTPFDETMDAMDIAVRQGKVRAVGVSNFTLDQLKECEAARRVDVVQYDYNMLDRRRELDIFPYCRERGIGVMIWGTMGFGLLSGTWTAETRFGGDDYRDRGGSADWEAGILDLGLRERYVQLVDDLKPIAGHLGKTMSQLAIRWALSSGAVDVALVGSLSVAELEENLGFLGWALSGEDLRQIDEVFEKHGVDAYPNQGLNP